MKDVVWSQQEDVPIVEFMSLVFTPVPGESHCRWLGSLFYLCYAFCVTQINSLVCWFLQQQQSDHLRWLSHGVWVNIKYINFTKWIVSYSHLWSFNEMLTYIAYYSWQMNRWILFISSSPVFSFILCRITFELDLFCGKWPEVPFLW